MRSGVALHVALLRRSVRRRDSSRSIGFRGAGLVRLGIVSSGTLGNRLVRQSRWGTIRYAGLGLGAAVEVRYLLVRLGEVPFGSAGKARNGGFRRVMVGCATARQSRSGLVGLLRSGMARQSR